MNNKKVLISGGSRGIGRAMVERFCRSGYHVAFIYNRSENEASILSSEMGAYAIKADISNPSEAAEAVRTAVSLLGGIDILINNAGMSQIKMMCDITDEDFYKMTSLNLGGAFTLAREASREMVRQKYGRIINIGSMWGKCGASCEVHYSASKAGIRGMTMALAKELGPSGITVNCIEPGLIDTEMNRELDSEAIRAICEETPLMRMGSTEDVSALAIFLASDDASFITGQCIGVDGGYAI